MKLKSSWNRHGSKRKKAGGFSNSKHMESWKPAERKFEAMAEKTWQLTQAVTQMGRIWTKTGTISWDLAKENGWTNDQEDMANVWKEKIFLSRRVWELQFADKSEVLYKRHGDLQVFVFRTIILHK